MDESKDEKDVDMSENTFNGMKYEDKDKHIDETHECDDDVKSAEKEEV